MDLRDRIYEMLRPTEWSAEATEPAGLTCTMRGYQRRALAWMAHRECSEAGASTAPEGFADSSAVWNGTQHPCWQRATLPSGLHVYHNWFTGVHSSPIFATFLGSPLKVSEKPHTIMQRRRAAEPAAAAAAAPARRRAGGRDGPGQDGGRARPHPEAPAAAAAAARQLH